MAIAVTEGPGLVGSLLLGALIASLCLVSGARATTVDLAGATIADIDAAFDKGTLTSEKLVKMYLRRIAAYDKQGPAINAVITLNPKALETAKALDKELMRARRHARDLSFLMLDIDHFKKINDCSRAPCRQKMRTS